MTKTNKNPKHVEVLVASTIEEVWKSVNKTLIATQKMNSADADYIAFFRVQIENKNGKLYSAITHIAKVKSCNNNALLEDHFKRNPELLEFSKEKGKNWEKKACHKEYYIEKPEELSKPILCRKGDGKRCQVKLYTTLEELNKANYLGDIKTIYQLEEMKLSIPKE